MEVADNRKLCRTCRQLKPLDRFASDRKCRDGLSTRCKDCMAAYASERYQRLRLEQGAVYRPSSSAADWLASEARGSLRCRVCLEEKNLGEFRVSYRAPRRRRICRNCERHRCLERHRLRQDDRRKYHLEHRCRQYGLTPREYERMVVNQDGRCAICERPLDCMHQTIDHCHRTGKVRGIVHRNCNLVLGNAREDARVLQGAIAYLNRHREDDSHCSLETEQGAAL